MSKENTETETTAASKALPISSGSTPFDPLSVVHKNEPNQMKPNGTQEDVKKFFGDLPKMSEVQEAIAPKYRRMRW